MCMYRLKVISSVSDFVQLKGFFTWYCAYTAQYDLVLHHILILDSQVQIGTNLQE